MSTYSPSLRIELIGTGDQAGVWGNTTNTNLGTLMESSIAGYTSVSVISANQAFTALNGAPDEARQQTIALTTTTGADFAVYAPPAEKTYVIYNASAYIATIYNSTVIGNTTAAGTGVAIPAGATVTVWTEGTNFRLQNTHLTSPTISSPTMTGTPVAPTAAPGTNTTQIATTAFVTNATSGLGTMAAQNANNVSITGGSITGITDLAIADGGTGASTAANARTNLGLVIGTDVLAPNGSGASLTNLNASNLATGTVATARLASGTANSSTYLRGDGTWAALSPTVSAGTLYQSISVGNGIYSASPTIAVQGFVYASGTVRVRWSMSTENIFGVTYYGQVYRNGSPVGTLRSLPLNSSATYTDDISISTGDLVQLYGYTTPGNSGLITLNLVAIGTAAVTPWPISAVSPL